MKKHFRSKYAILFILLVIIIGTFAVRKRMDNDFQGGQSYEAWKNQYQVEDDYYKEMSAKILAPDFNFTGIELVFVGPGEKYFSRWGHVFLRFVGSEANPEEDLSLSFLVDANEYDVDNWKGFVGGKYKIYPLINPIKDHIKHYVTDQKRFLKRYAIPSNEANKELLIKNLRSYINDRSSLGTWSFYNNNCTNILNRYLSSSGFKSPLKEDSVIFPTEMVETYQKIGIMAQDFKECTVANCEFKN